MVDLRMYICNVWWNSALSVNARQLRSRLLKGKPRPKPRVGELFAIVFILSLCPLGVARVEAR